MQIFKAGAGAYQKGNIPYIVPEPRVTTSELDTKGLAPL